MRAIAAAMAVGTAGLALIGAPVAYATPNNCSQYSHSPSGYVSDMRRCGFASLKSDEAMMETGQRLCAQMRAQNADGYGPSKVRQAVQDAMGWDLDTSANYVAITLADLCPDLVTYEPIPTPSVPYPSNFPPGAVNPHQAPVQLPPGYRDGD